MGVDELEAYKDDVAVQHRTKSLSLMYCASKSESGKAMPSYVPGGSIKVRKIDNSNRFVVSMCAWRQGWALRAIDAV